MKIPMPVSPRCGATKDCWQQGDLITFELLRRSFEQIAKSVDLLKIDAPKGWHPQYYRAHKLNDDGHFGGFTELICADDDEAKFKAAALLDGHDIEVWQQDRMVVLLKALRAGR